MPGIMLDTLKPQDELFIRDVSTEYLNPTQSENTGFLWDSGVVVETEMARELAASSSQTAVIRHVTDGSFWEDSEEIDSPLTCGPCDGVEMVESRAVRNIRHKCFEQEACIRLFTAENEADLLGLAARRRADYWKVQYEKTAITQLLGIMNGNIASDGSDMVADLINNPLDGTNTNLTAVGLADAYGKTAPTVYRDNPGFNVLLIHPNKAHDLRMQGYVPVCCNDGGAQASTVPSLMGPNGEMVVVANERVKGLLKNGDVYTTIMAKRGSIGYGDGSNPHTQSANIAFRSMVVTEDRCAGRVIDLFARYVVAPAGFSWLGTNQAKKTPSFAEFADGANWERVVPTDRLPFGFIQSH